MHICAPITFLSCSASVQALTFDVTFLLLIRMERMGFRGAIELRE